MKPLATICVHYYSIWSHARNNAVACFNCFKPKHDFIAINMAINLPPVARTSKRAIPGTRVFDAAKVFADYNSDTSKAGFTSHYRTTFDSTQDKFRSINIHRAGKINKPDPTNVHFLYDNTRFTNEPVCHAATKSTRRIQHEWWPDKIPADTKPRPSFSCESSNRSDFRPIDSNKRPNGLTRFSCIAGKRTTALGIVPVTELPSNHMKTERISYIHQFDARKNTRERGKLHGSFVWDTTNTAEQKLQRRFAKRNFIHEEMESPRKPFTHEGRAEQTIRGSGPDRGAIITEQVAKTESKEGKCQGADILVMENVRPQKPPKETDNLKLPIATKDKRVVHHNSSKLNSPPPHLC